MIDTHSHIYSEEFDADIEQVIQQAKEAGVESIVLPGIDSKSFEAMTDLASKHPGYCFKAMGLHPTSVDLNFEEELTLVRSELEKGGYVAVGEIGTDLYWDKTYIKEQQEALRRQLGWAIEFGLPVIIHLRESFKETMEVFREFPKGTIRGIFHSFTGSKEEAAQIFELGDELYLGINGIVTFKNSGLDKTLEGIPLQKLVLETDAPYLTPTPHRGKRNEPAYLSLVKQKLAMIYGVEENEIEKITTKNAVKIFKLQ